MHNRTTIAENGHVKVLRQWQLTEQSCEQQAPIHLKEFVNSLSYLIFTLSYLVVSNMNTRGFTFFKSK